MINTSRRSGYALMLALLFMIIAGITSIGIYAYSGYIAREIRVDKKTAARSYYYSVAGTRYAQILLSNPTAAAEGFGFPDDGFNGDSRSITVDLASGNPHRNLAVELGFSGSDKLTITATETPVYADDADEPLGGWNTYQISTIFTRLNP